MPKNFIVVNNDGLNVRTQMDTTNKNNLLRWMSGSGAEGFVVYEIYQKKGMTGLQTWGRISDNPGGILQEYVCLQIGNRVYAKEQTGVSEPGTDLWHAAIDAWARSKGFDGPLP